MKFTIHAMERYVERVVGITDKNKLAMYVANNQTTIDTTVKKMIANGIQVYRGKNFFQEYTKAPGERINQNLPIRMVVNKKFLFIIGVDSQKGEDMIITIIDTTEEGGANFYDSLDINQNIPNNEKTKMLISIMNERRK